MLEPSDRLTAAFNEQIGHEFSASLQYIAVANFFAGETLTELARFFYRQADEEREHAMKFINFLLDAGASPEIPSIPAPRSSFDSAEQAVDLSLKSEKRVTEQIYTLVEKAREDKNLAAQRFLDWFVSEQLEEVSSMSALLQVVRRAGDGGLLHVEDYLAREGSLGTAEAGS